MFHKLTRYYLFITSLLLLSCNSKVEQGFEKIPPGLNATEALIRAIQPDKKFEHWVCFRQDFPEKINAETEVITAKGEISKIMNIKFNLPKSGFKNEILHGYYYIAYLENDSVKLVINEKQLIKFIGNINSMGESLLIARMRGLSIDYSQPIGGSYKTVKNGYEFYLVKFHNCTVRTEPFKVYIDTQGNYKAKSLGFFYNVDDNKCFD